MTKSELRRAELKRLFIERHGTFAWYQLGRESDKLAVELRKVVDAFDFGHLDPIEVLMRITMKLARGGDDIAVLMITNFVDDLEEMLATPPTPTPAAAVDPRDGDGWEDAVTAQGIRVPAYPDFLKTQHWELCKEAWKVGHCARCKQHGRTDLHHLDYARLGQERPEGVIELCRACHDAMHALRRAA